MVFRVTGRVVATDMTANHMQRLRFTAMSKLRSVLILSELGRR